MGTVLDRHVEVKRARTAVRLGVLMRWIGVIAGVAVIGWSVALGVRYAGPFLEWLLEIKEVTVEGVRRLDRREVIDLVKLQPGAPLHHIVSAVIKERVESHPWIKEATVSLVPFHELRISVVERVPAAVVRAGAENFLVDGEGHVLASLSQADEDSLPFVTGVDRKGLLLGDADVRRAIMDGIELAAVVGRTYEGRVQVNAADPADLVASVRGVQFHFGEGAIEEQWGRFQQVKSAVKVLDVDGYGDGANDVDLRYESRVVVRERG